MKRIRQLLLTLSAAIILAGYASYPANAAEQVQFSLTGTSGNAGGEAELPVNIYSGSEVAGIDIIISYEPKVFQCSSVLEGDLLNEGYFDINHDDKAGTVHLVYVSLSGLKEEGPLLTLKGTFVQDVTGLYSPQIEVVEIVDSSKETKALPYMVERDGEVIEEKNGADGGTTQGALAGDNAEISKEDMARDSQKKTDNKEVKKRDDKGREESEKKGIMKSNEEERGEQTEASRKDILILIIGLFGIIVAGLIVAAIRLKRNGKIK